MAHFNLDKILNLEKWQELQDSLADITNLAIITIDFKGKPVSAHSNCTPFCQKIRANKELAKMCQKCDSRAGLEAVRSNRPYVYLCHYNIIDIAIPITIDDKYIGAVMAGQVKPLFGEMPPDLEQILYSPANLLALQESKELKSLYKEIPAIDYTTILKSANMLFMLCNYLTEEAAAKNQILDMYYSPALAPQSFPQLSPVSNHLHPIKSPSADALIPLYNSSSSFTSPTNKKLLPALEYIYTNTHLMVSLERAAQLCHLSTGYFSRSFAKEFGTNYTAYTSKLKIEWAKELLTKTDLPVTRISDQLGFNDSGYFTKIFKKYEYLTPSLYRQYSFT